MTCQRPNCGHPLSEHDGSYDGTGSAHEPCMVQGCDCPDYLAKAQKAQKVETHVPPQQLTPGSPVHGGFTMSIPMPVSDTAFSYGDASLDHPESADRKAAAEGRICPTCGSTAPERHPAVQYEGEVSPCRDSFHNVCTCDRKPGKRHRKNCAEVLYRTLFHPVLEEQGDVPSLPEILDAINEVPQLVSDEKIEREEAEREQWHVGPARVIEPQSKTVTKWADPAMFTAEPVAADEGPKVYLLWMTPDPLGAIAATTGLFKGKVIRSLADVTDEERHDAFEQISKTHLKAPFEFVQFHFLIEGVTRGFTHQMVRQRTATYVQESTRFAVKEDMPVGLPPSLAGLPEDDRLRRAWDKFVEGIGAAYNGLVDSGVPAEDARGLLPTNVLTRLHYRTDLRALLEHGGNRLCTQAQFEWRLVFTRIVEAIRNYRPYSGMEWEEPAASVGQDPNHAVGWQFEKLADMFRPICYLTGKCEFRASFDRPCSIRDRVDMNAGMGRPSSEWHESSVGKGWPVNVAAIRPEEWLLNPDAAR